MGGFECSTHRRRDGRRLDLIAATQHDRYARRDYERLAGEAIRVARDGIRWHLIEPREGYYDWSSVLPMLQSARDAGVKVIWDLCHYGWPDDIDIFSPTFIDRFARLARAFARLVDGETEDTPYYVPVNEISFWSWGSGVGYMNPFATGRPLDLKQQLVRAAIAGCEAVWDVNPRARIMHVDPIINVIPQPDRPEDAGAAEERRLGQYQSWDMLAGYQLPQVGGHPKYLDIIGANYYPYNQWYYDLPRSEGITIFRWHKAYRPLSDMLAEVYARYGRPLVISETGAEDGPRPGWLRYVSRQARLAIMNGVPLHGICWYPIMNRPGWEDDRHCHDGLWEYCDDTGEREIYRPLARELARQNRIFADRLWQPAQTTSMAEEELS